MNNAGKLIVISAWYSEHAPFSDKVKGLEECILELRERFSREKRRYRSQPEGNTVK
jgi:hypothetical protein